MVPLPGQTPTPGPMDAINAGLKKKVDDAGLLWAQDPGSMDLSPYRRSVADSGAAQAAYNRPTTTGPFGSNTVGADGSITSAFTGGFGALNDNLTSQAANAAANPMDWGQFGTLGTGEAAGQQTAQAAYGQSLSRLSPYWQKSESKLNRNLFQSGMADSDAGDATVGEFGRARNDAYAGAMGSALQSGQQAQQQAFQGNLASRQGAVANALRGQTQPFEELSGMQQFLQQPEVGRDNSMLMRDTAFNQAAPLAAQRDTELAQTNRVGQPFAISGSGPFDDQPGDPRPGMGAERRAEWDSYSPEKRETLTAFRNRNGNTGYRPPPLP